LSADSSGDQWVFPARTLTPVSPLIVFGFPSRSQPAQRAAPCYAMHGRQSADKEEEQLGTRNPPARDVRVGPGTGPCGDQHNALCPGRYCGSSFMNKHYAKWNHECQLRPPLQTRLRVKSQVPEGLTTLQPRNACSIRGPKRTLRPRSTPYGAPACASQS